MLDGILGRGFSSKCKLLIKPTRTRINVVRKRKEATQRFLKGNLAQLLDNGLDIDAYGRVKQTEEFIAGQNLLSCYDFIEQSFEYLLKQLSVMQKLRECPTECREAVGSLMFAAARFSDLPELRDLRDTFQERYGSSLEHFVNQEFVKKLTLKAPPMDKKLKLLQGIALEFSITWDSRGFEQRMANPSAFAQDQPKKYESIHVHDDKYKSCNGKETVRQTDKGNHNVLIDNGHRVCNDNEENLLKRDELDCQFFVRKELSGYSQKPLMGREQAIPKSDNYDIPFQGRREFTGDKHESLNGKEDTALKTVRPGHSSRGRRRPEVVDIECEVYNDQMNRVPSRDGHGPVPDGKLEAAARVAEFSSRSDGKDVSSTVKSVFGKSDTANSASKVQKEETDGLKSYSSYALPPPYIKRKDKILPPPYIKSKDSKYGVNAEAKHANSDNDGTSMDKPSRHKRDNAVHGSERTQGDSDHPTYENQVAGPAQVSIHGPHGHEKDVPYRDGIPLPKTRSNRRKHSKSPSGHEDPGNHEDDGVVKRSSSSRRRDNSSRGSQILIDDDVPYRDGIPLPKTRSNRRKHSKSPSGHEDPGNHEDDGVVKRSSSSRRRDNSSRGSQILIDDEHHRKDEEEIMMDKLLLHYSKKPSTYDPEKVRRKSKAHALHQIDADTVETLQYFSRDGHDVQTKMVPPPTRSISLPREQTASMETVKVYARANSFQPDKPAQHVHPKLPEYDDLVARFAALRGR